MPNTRRIASTVLSTQAGCRASLPTSTSATPPRCAQASPIAVRDCLVYDDFADRFAAQMSRQSHLPIPPFFQPATVYQRLAHHSGPAGFNDAQIMSGNLREVSDMMFAVIASRTGRSQ